MDQEIVFTERQKFNQWWLWLILGCINGIFLFGLVKQLIFGLQFGNNPLSNAGLILLTLAFIAFTFFFYKMGLYTKIDKHGIYFRFIPFHTAFKFYPWEKISNIKVCRYKALSDYGGWGIRGGRNGTAYTVSGDTGIEIELHTSDKILIGTRKPEEVKKIIEVLSPLRYMSFK
jgi:hypothetical protein